MRGSPIQADNVLQFLDRDEPAVRPLLGEPPDADQFAGFLVTHGLTDNTVRNYRCLYQRWLDWCATEGKDPMRLDPLDLRAWSKTVKGSRAMVAQVRATVGWACRLYGVEERQEVIPSPRRAKPLSRALPADQAEALEVEAHRAGVAGTAVLVGLYTAARRSEIAAMEWPRFRIIRHEDGQYGGSVTFWRQKMRDWHTIPLHPVLAEHLEQRRMPGEQWLFPGRYGGHVAPAVIWRRVLDVAERAGVGKVTPHQLRHTALTMANDYTRDLRAVMDLAGHTNPETTARYTTVSTERLEQAVASLDYHRQETA